MNADPDDVGARRGLALVLARSDPAAAAQQYREILRRAPDLVEVRHQLVGLLAQQGRHEAAAEELGRLAEYRPQEAEWPLLEADHWVRAGKHRRAKQRMEEALKELGYLR